jgi:FSR family fosmidomycin resistance protein-like MFS transporter
MYFPRKRLFWAVSLGHLTNDTFISMSSVLLAFISVNVMPLRDAEIGLVLSVAALVGALAQPLFGWLADRSGGRWLGAVGVAWTVALMLVALLAAENRVSWLMVLAFILPAVGSGAFHPVGAMYASDSDKKHAATNISVFFLLGQMGLALGPALAGLLLNNATSNNNRFSEMLGPVFAGRLLEQGSVISLLGLGVFALPAVLLMALLIPSRKLHAVTKSTTTTETRRSIPVVGFVVLVAMVALRSLAQPGSVNFIPVLFQSKGWTPAEYGLITSLFWLASGLAGVVFGYLADHFDSRWVVAISLVLSAPVFFLLPVTDGALAFVLAIIGGGLTGASHSIIVLSAQSLMPGSKGFASGAIMGLIFGTGAVGSFLIGVVSDAVGLATAFQWVSIAIVLASVLALALPADPRKAKAPANMAPAESSDSLPTRV